ncbi:hybrid sensor histidine kinase/response regulator [Butyrivibrio sp. WCE2006]|uniref:hybrid sensor histidine kinase/response regulator n=1 Tax=Butyrivibrio sp. WCE2006 TaxID=1410611 RepID=UPI0005D1A659|nr:ATP-binding protein [Butyrivibrio sp. WCE2006]
MRSEKLRKWVIPFFTVILFVFLVISVNIIQDRFIYRDRITQLTTYYTQLESIIATRFTRYFNILKSWSYHLDNEESSGINDFISYVSAEKRIWEIDQVYFFNDKGEYRDADGKIGTLKEKPEFIENLSKEGEMQVTHIIGAKGMHHDLFVLGIKPEKFENKEYCAIGLAIDTSEMKNRLTVSKGDMGNSQNYLVDIHGNLIITSVDLRDEKKNIVEYAVQNGEIIYDPTGLGLSKAVADRMTGVIVISIDGVEYYLSYVPCEFEDSMLVCLTPSETIDRSITEIKKINNILLIAAFSIVLAIMMLIMRSISMRNMLNVANSANEAKTRFLANMSHDFRTPMNAISGYLSLMKENANNPEKVIEYGEKAEYAHRNILNMINYVLALSKMENGGDEIISERFSLNDVLLTVKNEMGALAEGKHQIFSIDRSNVKEDAFMGDANKLEIILKNLVQNSITYTDENGEIKLEVFPEDKEDKEFIQLRFEIKDNGIGMSEEFIRHVFEPFQKESRKNASKEQGTGLGLTVTKGIIDMLGGTIEAESRINEGSTFIVRLSFGIAEKTELEEIREIEQQLEKNEEDHEEEKENAFKGMRFLAAEDNELNAEILVEILKLNEAELIDVAEDGEKVVSAFEEKEPGYYDMILMDIQMPNMNGYEAAKAIRNLADEGRKDAKTIPIIAMSANAFREDIEEASESGMDAHIAKPIDIKLFENTVKAFKCRGHETV